MKYYLGKSDLISSGNLTVLASNMPIKYLTKHYGEIFRTEKDAWKKLREITIWERSKLSESIMRLNSIIDRLEKGKK